MTNKHTYTAIYFHAPINHVPIINTIHGSFFTLISGFISNKSTVFIIQFYTRL